MLPSDARRLQLLDPRTDRTRGRRLRRGAYVLPSLFTLSNMICGYASVVHAMRGDFETAALLIGAAYFFDALDGAVARLMQTESAFGFELDSLADIISFGVAPAMLSFAWGLWPIGRPGWAAGFMFVACAALRLARFNIQSAAGGDKRYFVGLPSPAAASIPAATVFAFPYGLQDPRQSAVALAMVIVPALLMVSTIRFRAFKNLNLRGARSYRMLLPIAAAIFAVAVHPKGVLLVLAYGYLLSGIVGLAMSRIRHYAGRSDGATP